MSSKTSAEVVGARELRRRRRAARKHRMLRRAITWTLVVGALTGGGIALVHSSLFALNGIEVRGTHFLSAGDVVQASGLRLGMNVLSVDGRGVSRKLDALPLVAGVRIQRIYPSKVRIIVREKTPGAVAFLTSGAWLVSPSGALIAPATSLPPSLPVVRVMGVVGSSSLTEGLRLWGELPDWGRAQTVWINALDETKLIATFAGTRVIFGTADELPAKLQALTAIFQRARAGGHRVVSLDLRAPMRPAAVLS